MATSLTPALKKLLSAAGCYFERQGKGDHEIWYSPLTDRRFVSELFILAMREYLQQHGRQLIIESLNEADADGLDESEKFMLEKMCQYQRQLQENEEKNEP